MAPSNSDLRPSWAGGGLQPEAVEIIPIFYNGRFYDVPDGMTLREHMAVTLGENPTYQTSAVPGPMAVASGTDIGQVEAQQAAMQEVVGSIEMDNNMLQNAYTSFASSFTMPTFEWTSQYLTVDPATMASDWVVTPSPTPMMPRKKKVAKIKKNAPVADIAKAIGKYTKGKAKKVADEVSRMEATITSEEAMMEEKKRNLESAKNRIQFYKVQRERLGKKSSDVQKEFERAITEVQAMDSVESVTIDSQNRIIVTTNMLSVQKDGWDESREVGKFQIRIDFSEIDISDGVRALNITQRCRNTYDSPTINETRCCWGNIQRDITRDFYTQNIQELVLDMLEYVHSPHEEHGYLGHDGDKTQGWEEFFDSVEEMPKKFSWEMYDKEHGEGGSHSESDGYISLEPDLLLDRNRDGGPIGLRRNGIEEELQLQLRQAQQRLADLGDVSNSPDLQELQRALAHLGLVARAAVYFSNIIMREHEGRDVGYINMMRLIYERNFYSLIVEIEQSVSPELSSHNSFDFVVNPTDVRPDRREDLARNREYVVRVMMPRPLAWNDPMNSMRFASMPNVSMAGDFGPTSTPAVTAAANGIEALTETAMEQAYESIRTHALNTPTRSIFDQIRGVAANVTGSLTGVTD